MSSNKKIVATIDANQAVAHVSYRVNEVCAIYPITPSSPMAEHCDEWAARGITNIWGNIPEVVEMQHEGGAAGAVHGALQAGALTTTYTASQGLLLMIPNMYKIAGELTPTVFQVAARSLAAQALSIFGDHSDVMACRTTGFAMLASASVQEAHDMAIISQAATLESRIPFIHFFDGFRTSHEVNKLTMMSDEVIREMIDDKLVRAHRRRALNPDHPFIRGTAQNPDTYFQGRETVNAFYEKTPAIVEAAMEKFGRLTGREYHLFDYIGHPKAERVVVLIGSAAETAIETVEFLQKQGEKVGVVQVRLYRPWPAEHFLNALPKTVKSIAVLDRTKEPGAPGEPLYMDVVTTLAEASGNRLSKFSKLGKSVLPVGGRYGLSSKEFTPAMVKGVFDELKKEQPKNHFTIGINDDVTHTSLDYDPAFSIEQADETKAIFFGLGADGTVGANKNSIKIIGENTDLFAQGYFVYDSKKSGSQTVSHLRFGPRPIRRPYLIAQAGFVACHLFNFIKKEGVLKYAAPGATFLLNSPYPAVEVWGKLPRPIQQQIIDKKLKFYVIDANQVALDNGMGRRINTVMQTCFFALSGVLPKDEAITQIKKAIEKTYSKMGKQVVEMNFKAVDASLKNLHQVKVPARVSSKEEFLAIVSDDAPEFVKEVTAVMMNSNGDDLPVSKIPVDGTYPSGTTKWEKRNIASFIPVWEPDICIQCGNCSFVCPHSVIRSKFYHEGHLTGAPEGFKAAPISARGFPETKYTLQIFAEDCTGCGLCVDVCPAKSLKESGVKAINMTQKEDEMVAAARANINFFEKIPINDRSHVDFSSVRGAQFLEPLFEFSGACAGCGETPYIRLLSQLFGARLIVANATGCSSIYGGNQPTTPWTVNKEGRGPAWSNSLFEDNAEFGMGMRVATDKHLALAQNLLKKLAGEVSAGLAAEILDAPQHTESEIREQRVRVAELKAQLLKLTGNAPSNGSLVPEKAELASDLLSVADQLVRRSVWLIGGDGWAYDIGSSGLDHAMASGRNVNILVLDTEVYSNTGGQMSKATPTAATAKFAFGGKKVGKKDLALQAISYGNVYVAQVAMGANPQQTLLALREAEAYPGPSLILAYSHCIAHGIDMTKGLQQQDLAVAAGYWPLMRYNPELRKAGENPFVLDSPRPTMKLREYAYNEMRYKALTRIDPPEAERLMGLAQELVNLRWKTYEDMAAMGAADFTPVG
ncbi:MAG: pyruvate:ferredoxin (flavodoxin) oxidoreductase [Saprospiraceae bacterium]|nr:MAG: pyruvate:ferredoxin (flavodoxin) oxidoreductase [Saprospiraceae bacterium]